MSSLDRLASHRQRWRHAIVTVRLLGPYAVFGLLKRITPLARLARWAWLRPVEPRDAITEAAALRCMVRLRSRLGAERGDCLHGSLALYRVLSRAGSNPTLVVGFRRDAGSVAGHAWVEINGSCVVESSPRRSGFVPTFAFGPEGRLLKAVDAD